MDDRKRQGGSVLVRRGRRGVGPRLDSEPVELGVDPAGEDEPEHAVVAEQGPHGVAERGRAVALHEEVAVPRHAVPEHGRREERRGAARGGRERRAGERGQRAEEVPPPRPRLGVLAQVEAPELVHAPEQLPPRPRRLAAAPPHRARRGRFPFLSAAAASPACGVLARRARIRYTYQPTSLPAAFSLALLYPDPTIRMQVAIWEIASRGHAGDRRAKS